MIFYLDTNICIEYLKRPSDQLIRHFQKHSLDHIKIPSIVRYELLYGAQKSKNLKVKTTVDQFLSSFEVIPFCQKSADICASLRVSLETSGISIGMQDTMIASIVLANQGILVTNNTREFERVSSLKIQDWL